jgi:hypothetical protein
MEWEVWLEKGKLRNLITPPDIYDAEIAHVGGKRDREPPVINEDIKTHHAEKEKPRMFPTIRREFADDAEDKESKKSWESWLDKNNATETSHKDGEKKVEWDGKFSSSTIEDEVKNEDEKSESEEESLEELTDGDLVEIEKLKSEVDKIITDLTRDIKDPKRREDIVQRQAEQKVKETVTKAWELFLVNKPMNQFDKQPQKKRTIEGDGVTLDTNVGIVKDKLTETVPIKNPKGSLGNKKVKRIDHEAGDGSRKIVEIPKEENTNPEVKFTSGGRPESGKQGSVNASDGRHMGHKIEEGAENNSVLYNALAEEAKEKEVDNKTDDPVVISNDESEPATPIVPETPEAKRKKLIQATYRKRRGVDGKIIKSWESWLEKNSLDGKQSPDGLPKLTAGGKEVEIEAKNVIDRDDRGKKNEMYKSWLEKMQGAGDARFGNQHLTGLDQKPVNNEEDEANILPEKEEKTDNKEEKQEKTDNKPYKALGEE